MRDYGTAQPYGLRSVHVMIELTPSQFESLIQHLGALSDALVRKVYLEWEPALFCRITFGWWENAELPDGVTLEIRGLSRFFWAENFAGSIECGVLVLKSINRRIYVAIGGENTPYETDSDFNPGSAAMFAIGTCRRSSAFGTIPPSTAMQARDPAIALSAGPSLNSARRTSATSPNCRLSLGASWERAG